MHIDADKDEKSFIDTLFIYALWYKFQTILMPISDFGKISDKKIYSFVTFLF